MFIALDGPERARLLDEREWLTVRVREAIELLGQTAPRQPVRSCTGARPTQHAARRSVGFARTVALRRYAAVQFYTVTDHFGTLAVAS